MDEIESRTFRGSLATFVVLSRSRIAHTVIDEPHIVISIGDPGDPDAKIAESAMCRGILRLQFDDIDPQRRSLRHGAAMTEEDARAILAFVREHVLKDEGKGGISTIVCQCGLGMSRSAAVAAALSNFLQGSDAFFFTRFSPNYHVYRTLFAARDDEWRSRDVTAIFKSSYLDSPYPLAAKDFLSLESLSLFSMAGRWTDPKYNVLPAEALATIRPLTEAKAVKIRYYCQRYLSESTAEHRFEVPKANFTDIERIDASKLDAEPVRVWLGERNIDPETSVIVSWDSYSEIAVLATWGVFCRYWDDFCYPTSDEVIVWPESEAWSLAFWHEEQFSFGVRRSAVGGTGLADLV